MKTLLLVLVGIIVACWVVSLLIIGVCKIKGLGRGNTTPLPAPKINNGLETPEKIRSKALAKRQNLDKVSSHRSLLAVYLGGSKIDMKNGTTVYICSIDNDLVISHAVDAIDVKIPIKDITAVEISGPGTQTTNAGLIGGGFGLEGAAKGMLAAALVNAATTKTTTNTFLRVSTNDSEALFHFNDQEPSALRLTLSHLFVAADANKAYNAAIPTSISDELIKLQSLKEAGVLSEEEFSNAKQKLLA